jgi:hypothetical protein
MSARASFVLRGIFALALLADCGSGAKGTSTDGPTADAGIATSSSPDSQSAQDAPSVADGLGVSLDAQDAGGGQLGDAGALVDAADAPAVEDAPVVQLVDGGLDQDGDAGPSCPPGYNPAGTPTGGYVGRCDPTRPGTLPCTRPRDLWCPLWCSATTICSPAGWVCCSE